MYKCKECGTPVIVTPDGEMIRACEHTGTVIADCEAVATGTSSFSG